MSIKCEKCGYSWIPRKSLPKCCPRCKRYLPSIVGETECQSKKSESA